MTLAEKHYREWNKIPADTKLSNDQWRIVNMMHECLRKYNTPKLPHGTILVQKQRLVDHLKSVKSCLNATDKLLEERAWNEFANSDGGKRLAKIWNALNMAMQSVLHFEFKVPLERLSEEITDALKIPEPERCEGCKIHPPEKGSVFCEYCRREPY